MAFQSYPAKGGIPSGNTAARPSSPVVGDTYYNGETGVLEIYANVGWIPCSSPAATPTITGITDVGTGRAYGNGALTVAFSPSTAGGATLGFYAYANNTTTSSATSPVTVTGLNGGTTYNVTGAAYNGFGASAPTGITTGTPTTVPDSVSAPSISAGIGAFLVTWSAPNTGGKTITEYTATAYDSTLTAVSTATTTGATSVTLTGLTAGTYYTVKVKAKNDNGYGVFGAASASTTPISSFSADVLVVAGGGGGGSGNGFESGAGAGAGGFRYNSSYTISGPFTVTVGAGGGKSTVNNVPGGKGGNSVLGTITSTGGGYGGTYTTGGQTGGSGGGKSAGGTYGNGNEGGYTPVEGYRGDNGTGSTSSYKGGGGGGAGSTAYGNSGGSPASYSITGSSVQYAGGGSGGGNLDGSSGAPSPGGGGGAGTTGNGGDATANTGGGGAGGSGQYGSTGGNGGAGVVILAYPNTYPAPASIGAGLTYDTPTRSGYRVYRFTAGTGTVTF